MFTVSARAPNVVTSSRQIAASVAIRPIMSLRLENFVSLLIIYFFLLSDYFDSPIFP
jgi:hypothetical protein